MLSLASSSCAASAGVPSLPAAFKRGAILKEMSSERTGPSVKRLATQSASIPFRFLDVITSSPALTSILFTPLSSITSATVPRATRSRKCLRFGIFSFCHILSSTSLRLRAIIKKKATPAPDIFMLLNVQSACAGLIIAFALGKILPTW